MVIRSVIFFLLLLTISSCSSSTSLYKGLSKEKATISYLFEESGRYADKKDTLQVRSPIIVDTNFRQTGEVEKVRSMVIPLIFFNQWKSEYTYIIGAEAIKEDVPSFIQTSLVEEFDRRTKVLADSNAGSDLVLEIQVDSLKASGPYRQEGMVLFLLIAYSYSFGESAGPGNAYSKLSYTLKEGEDILLQGSADHHYETEPLAGQNMAMNMLKAFFNRNLAEGISVTLRENMEEIVEEVGAYLDDE